MGYDSDENFAAKDAKLLELLSPFNLCTVTFLL